MYRFWFYILFPPRFEAWTLLKCIITLVFFVFSSSLGNWNKNTTIFLFLVSFVNLNVETVFFPICFQLPNKFSSLENRKQFLKVKNLEKKQLSNCGDQKYKATITSFEFRSTQLFSWGWEMKIPKGKITKIIGNKYNWIKAFYA